MKIPTGPLQRIVFGVAVCALATAGVTGAALVTQPASTAGEPLTQQIEFVDPAADEAPSAPSTSTTPSTAPVAERAEKAAVRAETAADRAEVAAVKVEQIVATTTTTTVTSTTMAEQPTTTTTDPVDAVLGPLPTTTSSTSYQPRPQKRWVEIGRIPAASGVPTEFLPPVRLNLTLETGQLRISDPMSQRASGIVGVYGDIALWIGDGTSPDETACVPTNGCDKWVVADGEQTITVAQHWGARGSGETGWQQPYSHSADIVIEEYR